jgi:tripartite-type tricarboxylate transporter receptor subunit TctC
MKKILAIFVLLWATMSSHAQQTHGCGVVIDFPPGGTSDRYARLLQKYNSEFQVFYRPGGMSVPAVNFIGDFPNMIYLGSPVLFGNKSPVKNPPIELYKILIAAPVLALAKKEAIDWDALLTQKINIGIPGLGTSHHIMALQLKEQNPNIQIIPTGGDAKALPLIMNGDLDVYFISATSGLNWLNQFKEIKELFRVEFNKPYVRGNVKLQSVSFNGAFIHKNATPEQKQKAISCLETAIKHSGWTEELKAMGAGPVQLQGKEKEEALELYVETMKKYGL